MILAGDVGATKTNLGLFSSDNGRPELIAEKTFRSTQFQGLMPMLDQFVPDRERISAACFGVAGPIVGGKAEVTNLEWLLNARELASQLHIDHVFLINDLVATAYGLRSLGPEDFALLNRGRGDVTGNAALISAGTGLGECILYWDGQRHVPIPSEAGHTDFTPHDELTLDLARYVRKKYGFASTEHVISGPGLLNIYAFLKETGLEKESPSIAGRLSDGDPVAVIAQAAMDGECSLCVRALNVLLESYGAEAGNLALRTLALGGIYVGGGVAVKIRRKMEDGTFMRAFCNKDKLSSVLAEIPVRLILNQKAPLLGAAHYGLRQEEMRKAAEAKAFR